MEAQRILLAEVTPWPRVAVEPHCWVVPMVACQLESRPAVRTCTDALRAVEDAEPPRHRGKKIGAVRAD